MSQYNRSNPFLYTFDAVNQKLVDETQKAIKQLIILGITTGIAVILSIIRWILYCNSQIISITFSIGLFIYAFLEIRRSIRSNQTTQIDTIKYGNSALTYTYINNEEAFSQVNQINVQLGKVDSIQESIITYGIIDLIVILIQTVMILIYIFQ
jgi:hypothetical protein